MASVNKVILVGNCGRDPELRYLPSGMAVANISIATSSKRKDKNGGDPIEETEWHRVTFFDRLAEIVGDYVRSGSPIYIEGKIKYGKYTDKDGVEKTSCDIIADSMQLLGNRNDGGGGNGGGNQRQAPQQQNNNQGQQRQAPQGNPQGGGNQQRQQPDRQQGNGNQGNPGQQGNRQAPPQNNNQQRQQPAQNQRPMPQNDSGFDSMDSDIPFISCSMAHDMTPSKVSRMNRCEF